MLTLFGTSVCLFAKPYQGRALAEVLDDLNEQGLEIVYSSRLVRPDMHVLKEPSSRVPREILNEILPPHGLEAQDRPGDRIVVVRSKEEPERDVLTKSPFSATYRFEESVEVSATAATERADSVRMNLLPTEIESVAGAGDNVFRVLNTLPGVVGTSELGSGIAVRGGAPEQNLVLMDGVEIYNPYRLFGFTSAFNPETVDRVELSAGSLAPRYGDRLSSALVVDNRLGKQDKVFQGSAGASFVDANVVLEGKLPKINGSWILSGRRTYYDLIAGAATDGNFPSFGDVQAKLSWEPRPGQRLSITGLIGSESTSLDTETLDDNPGTPSEATRQFVSSTLDNEEKLVVEGRSRTRLVAMNFESSWGPKTWTRTTLSYYRFGDALSLDGSVAIDARNSSSRTEPLSELLFSRDVDVEDFALRQELRFELNDRHRLSTGIELHGLDTRWRYAAGGTRSLADANASALSFDTLLLPGASLPALLDSALDYSRFGIWAQDGFRAHSKILFTPGIRIGRSGIHGKTTLSPRLEAAIEVLPNLRVRTATGLYYQSPGYEKLFQSDYFVDLSAPDTRAALDSEKAVGVSAGVDWAPVAGVSVSVDGYRRSFSDALIGRLESDAERARRLDRYDFPTELAGELPSDPLVTTHPSNASSGRAWGFDITVARRATSKTSRFSGWASYSFSRSDRLAYGHRFPFDYDRRHGASLVGRVRLTGAMEISFTGRAHSGFPRTPAVGTRVAADEDRGDRDGDGVTDELVPARDALGALIYTQDFGNVSNRNTARWPSFGRLDARFSYHSGRGQGRWLFYVEFLNLFNRNNTLVVSPTIRFEATRPVIQEERVSSFPVLPNFGFRFRF